MELQRGFFCLFLLFFCFLEAASRRGRRRDQLETLNRQIRALEETQEEVRGDLATLQGHMKALKEVRSDLRELQAGVDALTSLVEASMPEDCWAAKTRGSTKKIVAVKPPGLAPREVVCEQVREGGGWTVMLARHPTHENHVMRENFNKTWKEYREGFGDLRGEFWIGNEVVHALTSQTPHQLYVLLEDWDGNIAEGMWNSFKIAGEAESYQLSVEGYQTAKSTTGDSFGYHHHRRPFSTYDKDNDTDDHEHCAKRYGGGWWYFQCHLSHLTGAALPSREGGPHAITWDSWKETQGLQSAYMAIRPLPPMRQSFETPASYRRSPRSAWP
uniref:Fibrinogen C-terminal domain-containing protein n=1 Tax=Scylla olivacea TaxID=85551 RepID=A0A0P4W2X4_SCYOL